MTEGTCPEYRTASRKGEGTPYSTVPECGCLADGQPGAVDGVPRGEMSLRFFSQALEFRAEMSDQPRSPDGPEERPEVPLPEALARLERGGTARGLGAAGRYAGLGLQFAASILLFLYAGQWLDRRMGTAPLFLYVGVFTGAGAAFYSMYRNLMADQKRDEAAAAAEKADRAQQERLK